MSVKRAEASPSKLVFFRVLKLHSPQELVSGGKIIARYI